MGAQLESNPNRWHKSMYNEAFAKASIGSKRFVDLAATQVGFLDSVLNLPERAKILDVPSGVGRHSILFAKKGYQVTGIDISRDCLQIAKRQFAHKNVKYKWGDMSDLSAFKGRYDCVLNLFTSFGYFHTDKENENVLREMYWSLKPGGKAVLNLIDRDWIMKIYQPVRWSEDHSVLTMEASRYDRKTKYNESQMVMIDRRKAKPALLHHHYHRVRLYSKAEKFSLMTRTGFRDVHVFGDFEGSKYKKGTSTHPIYIGRK